MGEVLAIFGGFIVFSNAYNCFLVEREEFKESVKGIGVGIVVVGAGLLLRYFGI